MYKLIYAYGQLIKWWIINDALKEKKIKTNKKPLAGNFLEKQSLMPFPCYLVRL